MTSLRTRLLLPALLLIGATACSDVLDASGSTSSDPAATAGNAAERDAADSVVEVHDNSFSPDAIEVRVDGRVVWNFSTADRPHNVVFSDDRASATLDEGTWSTSFGHSGTYDYECTLHPGMTGQVTVTS